MTSEGSGGTKSLVETVDHFEALYGNHPIRMKKLSSGEWLISASDTMAHFGCGMKPTHSFTSNFPKDMYMMIYDESKRRNECYFTINGLIYAAFRDRRFPKYGKESDKDVRRAAQSDRLLFQDFLCQYRWFGIYPSQEKGSVILDGVLLPYVFDAQSKEPRFDPSYLIHEINIKSKPSTILYNRKRGFGAEEKPMSVLQHKRNFLSMTIIIGRLYKKSVWDRPEFRSIHGTVANIVCAGLLGINSSHIPASSSAEIHSFAHPNEAEFDHECHEGENRPAVNEKETFCSDVDVPPNIRDDLEGFGSEPNDTLASTQRFLGFISLKKKLCIAHIKWDAIENLVILNMSAVQRINLKFAKSAHSTQMMLTCSILGMT